MNKPIYQLKDEILQYFIDSAKTTGRTTVLLSGDDFERHFGHNPIQDFMAQLLRDLRNENLIFVRDYTHYQSNYTVTAKGYDFMGEGGHTQQHVEQKKAKRQKANEYKLVSWKVKWFWISQVLALIALGVSIIALVS